MEKEKKEKKEHFLVGMEELSHIVKLIFMSGNLKNTKPLSLILVSKSGNGKTELITSFKKKTLESYTDISYIGLINLLVEKPHMTHLVLPDLLKITMKKKSTSDNLISALNACLEEGLDKVKLYGTEKDLNKRKIGLVTAITKDSMMYNKRKLESIGFLGRMIYISYDYTDETIEKIMQSINREEYFNYKPEKLPEKKADIKGAEEFNKQLNKFVDKRFRTLKQLQTLCKANALLNGRDKVTQKDVTDIIGLTRFMNLNYTKI